MLVGLDEEADCELSCEKWRAPTECTSAASDAVRGSSGRRVRSKLEAAEATNLLRDAMVAMETSGEWRTGGALRSSTLIGDCTESADGT